MPRFGNDDNLLTLRLWFTSIILLMGLVLALAVGVWNVMYISSDLSKDVNRELHVQAVLLETQKVLSALQDAETGQRGYVITAQPNYLEQYEAGVKAVDPAVNRLATLVQDDPIQTRRVTVLEQVIEAKLAELAETVSLMQNNHQSDALTVVVAEHGKVFMDQARIIIAGIVENELQQLTRYHSQISDAFKRSRVLSYATAIFGVCILAGSAIATFFAFNALSRSRSISAQLVAEKRLQEQTAEKFRTLAEGLPALCWTAQSDGEVDWYNQRWYHYTGTTPADMEGLGWQSVHDPERLPSVMERWCASIATGAPFEMTFPLRGADGLFRPFLTRVAPLRDANGQVQRWLGTNVDVTEAVERETALERTSAVLRQHEAQLQAVQLELESRVIKEVEAREMAQSKLAQAEKLSALGQLAGGIAHDFNNIMQAVSGGAGLIGRHANEPATVRRLSTIVEDAARRGVSVTRRLLAFARRGELRAEPVDLAPLLHGLHEVLTHTLGAAISVLLDVTDGLPPILADRGQLETVLVNLATNARDAMPKGGTITIAATSELATEDQHPEKLEPGNYVRLTITDTGTGIDAATLARVMEPFFTTKEQGKGTGLGLPMARGFAQQSGGTIAIASELGLGTAVTMWLPMTSPASIQPPPLAKFAVTPKAEELRLLLVDDEVLIREVLAEDLTDRGYEVIQAESGERALALLAAGQEVDLIISDLSMPNMDGVSLIRAVQALKPRLPAILLTGYVGDAASLAVGGALNGSFSLLRKPVTGVHLADRVAALLEARTLMIERSL